MPNAAITARRGPSLTVVLSTRAVSSPGVTVSSAAAVVKAASAATAGAMTRQINAPPLVTSPWRWARTERTRPKPTIIVIITVPP